MVLRLMVVERKLRNLRVALSYKQRIDADLKGRLMRALGDAEQAVYLARIAAQTL